MDKQSDKVREVCQECTDRRPAVPQVEGKNYYTNHIIRKMTLRLEHIRPKKAA